MARRHFPKTEATSLLEQRIHALYKRVPGALAGAPESIHQLRVAGRRLRVTLPLCAPKPEGQRVVRARRTLRQLVRAAGSGRDLDVSLDLFEERVGALDPPSPEILVLRRGLRSARTQSRGQTMGAVLDVELAQLRRDLRASVAREGEGLFSVLLRLREAREQLGDEIRTRLADLGGRFDAAELHVVRRRIRKLRYSAEVRAALRDEPSQAPVVLRELQSSLGTINDHHVMANWLARRASRTARRRAELADEAHRESEWFRSRAMDLHREFLDRDPAGTLDRALRAMGVRRSVA